MEILVVEILKIVLLLQITILEKAILMGTPTDLSEAIVIAFNGFWPEVATKELLEPYTNRIDFTENNNWIAQSHSDMKSCCCQAGTVTSPETLCAFQAGSMKDGRMRYGYVTKISGLSNLALSSCNIDGDVAICNIVFNNNIYLDISGTPQIDYRCSTFLGTTKYYDWASYTSISAHTNNLNNQLVVGTVKIKIKDINDCKNIFQENPFYDLQFSKNLPDITWDGHGASNNAFLLDMINWFDPFGKFIDPVSGQVTNIMTILIDPILDIMNSNSIELMEEICNLI